jgi:hypothetical protein
VVQPRECQDKGSQHSRDNQPDYLHPTAAATRARVGNLTTVNWRTVGASGASATPAEGLASATAAKGLVEGGQLNLAHGVAAQPPRGRDEDWHRTEKRAGVDQPAALFVAGGAGFDVAGNAFAHQNAEVPVPVSQDRTEFGAPPGVAVGAAGHQQRA